MSQKYKFKVLQLIEGNDDPKDKRSEQSDFTVYTTGETKSVDFELADGTRQNFHYSHYLTSWLGKENNEWVIKIFFATHIVTIKGYCLDKIYESLGTMSLKSLKVNDNRYKEFLPDDFPFITDIFIKWKNEDGK